MGKITAFCSKNTTEFSEISRWRWSECWGGDSPARHCRFVPATVKTVPANVGERPEVCVFFILHFSVFSIHFLHMPLPYSALREAMGKTPLSTLNFLRPAGGYPRTGISSNPGRAPMPRRGSDCSRPDCAPRPPRASARRPAAGSARPTGHNTSRFP